MNKTILQGRLTKDPEMSASSEGLVISKFTLAFDRYVKGKTNQTLLTALPSARRQSLSQKCKKAKA